MAKRVRGSSTRPGQRAPLQRRPTSAAAPVSAPTAAAAPRPASLTDEEERRAAELEAQIVDEERSAEDARKRGIDRTRRPVTDEAGARPASTLAVRAAEEYAYVGRDVKRITLIGGSLILIMLVLWVVAHAMGAGPI
jgi:hypothetical protein